MANADPTRIRSLLPHVLTLALCLVLTGHAETPVPMQTPPFAQAHADYEARSYQQNDLSMALGYHVRGHREKGSDQHFELDTFVHRGASTPWLIAGITNLMTEGGSQVGQAHVGTAGADIRGNVDRLTLQSCHSEIWQRGHADDVVCFEATRGGPDTGYGTRWSFVDTDHRSVHVLAGQTTQIDELTFANGFALRVVGDHLELVSGSGRLVQTFR